MSGDSPLRLTIHQPEFLPWLGFLHKISLAQTVIILDDIQYSHQYFQNRNKIRTKDGWTWLIVPVLHQPLDEWQIKSVEIDEKIRWRKKIIGSIEVNYSKCPYYSEYWPSLKEIFEMDYTRLVDLNMEIIRYLFGAFDLNPEIRYSSEFDITSKKGDLVFDLCKAVHASTYVSGISGNEYLTLDQFNKAGINVEFQEFHHPVYSQKYSPFIPCMSSVDLLFNHGPKSKDILKGIGVETIETIFT